MASPVTKGGFPDSLDPVFNKQVPENFKGPNDIIPALFDVMGSTKAEERITKALNTEHTNGGNSHRGRSGHVAQVVADALDMEREDVVGLMKQGQTLAQIIEDNDGSVEDIVDTLMAQAEERITKALNGERPEGMHQRRGRDGSADSQFRGRNRRGDARFQLRSDSSLSQLRVGDAPVFDLVADRGFSRGFGSQ